jgi:hypothetical protein
MTIRSLLAGILIGIALTLAVGAATTTPGKYQVAAAYAVDRSRLILVRINTQSGVVDMTERFIPVQISDGTPKVQVGPAPCASQ